MKTGHYIDVQGKQVFIEFGKDISKQILEQLKEPKKVKQEIKKKKGK